MTLDKDSPNLNFLTYKSNSELTCYKNQMSSDCAKSYE